jgi:hypothetical protein
LASAEGATREWYESAWKAFKAAQASAPARLTSSPLITKADLHNSSSSAFASAE